MLVAWTLPQNPLVRTLVGRKRLARWRGHGREVAHEPGHFNRLVEQEVIRLGGIKSLYSDSFFTRDEFARAYGMAEYERLKARYDLRGLASHLYEKCVGKP